MNREQCVGCGYFRNGNGGTDGTENEKFCHYMLYTGNRRARGKDGICLSKAKNAKRVFVPFDIPVPQR